MESLQYTQLYLDMTKPVGGVMFYRHFVECITQYILTTVEKKEDYCKKIHKITEQDLRQTGVYKKFQISYVDILNKFRLAYTKIQKYEIRFVTWTKLYQFRGQEMILELTSGVQSCKDMEQFFIVSERKKISPRVHSPV